MEIIFRDRERWDYVLSGHWKNQFLAMIKAMDEAKVSNSRLHYIQGESLIKQTTVYGGIFERVFCLCVVV